MAVFFFGATVGLVTIFFAGAFLTDGFLLVKITYFLSFFRVEVERKEFVTGFAIDFFLVSSIDLTFLLFVSLSRAA